MSAGGPSGQNITYPTSPSNGQVQERRREQLGDDPTKACEKLSEAEIRALCFELIFESDFYDQWSVKYSGALQDLCDQSKVDLKALEKDARKALAQAAEAGSTEGVATAADAP
jgi:hypothetical protein